MQSEIIKQPTTESSLHNTLYNIVYVSLGGLNMNN